MRAALVASILLVACGKNEPASQSPDAGSGSVGSGGVTLHLSSSGPGLVRGAGADCRGACDVAYPSGAQVHLVAVPDGQAQFAGWGGACSGTAACDLTLGSDLSVSATFALPPPPP